MIINHCLICSTQTRIKQVICDKCIKNLNNSLIDNYLFRCENCGNPLLHTLYKCPECDRREGLYIYSMYDYRDSFARNVLHKYKFEYCKKLRFLFANELQKFLDINNFDVIIPVPSSDKSVSLRGWDQMKEISRTLKNVRIETLIKNRKVDSEQKELGRASRIEESKNKYDLLDSNLDKDLKILLIDDVVTTGSTLLACYHVLKNDGFSNIHAFTFYAQL